MTIEVIGIHSISVLFTAMSTIIMINPERPPAMANIHVTAVNNTMPETKRTALPVSAVDEPLSVPKTDMRTSIITLIRASADSISEITESTVGAIGRSVCCIFSSSFYR